MLNYRHITLPIETSQPLLAPGIRVIASEEWTNYPLVLTVDDNGEGFLLTAHTDRRIDAHRVIGYISAAIQSLGGCL